MVFLCFVSIILFIMYFGIFVMTFIDNGEIGCMSIPKCHWMVIVLNLVKQTSFLHDAVYWCCFEYAGQYLWPLLLTWFNFNPSMDK